MKNRISNFCLVVFMVLTISAGVRGQVIVSGDPPLTEEMIGRFAEFFEWVFDVHLTNDQVNVLRTYSVEVWNKQTKTDIDAIVSVVQLQTELSKADPKKLAVVRASYEPQALESMRKQPNEPMAVWALAVYESSHKVLAAGNPPLTRQTSDAYLEAVFIMLAEAQGLPQETPDAKLKDDWAAATANNYARMPDAMKQQIAGMPLFVAQMRLNWPTMPETEKAKYRAAWAEALKPLIAPPVDTSTSANNTSSGNTSGSNTSGSKTSGRMMTAAQAMAEQNRRFRMHMNTSNAMMDIYKIKFNTQANFIGSSYRYW